MKATSNPVLDEKYHMTVEPDHLYVNITLYAKYSTNSTQPSSSSSSVWTQQATASDALIGYVSNKLYVHDIFKDFDQKICLCRRFNACFMMLECNVHVILS